MTNSASSLYPGDNSDTGQRMTVPATPIPDHPSNGSLAWLPTREDISLLDASTEAIFIAVVTKPVTLTVLRVNLQELLRKADS